MSKRKDIEQNKIEGEASAADRAAEAVAAPDHTSPLSAEAVAADAAGKDPAASVDGGSQAKPVADAAPSADALSPSSTNRFALLAASVAIAAALGGVIGSLTATGFASAPRVEKNADAIESVRSLQAGLAQLRSDVAALKGTIESASRASAAQLTKISERIDRADALPRLAAISESLARLEQRTATAASAQDVTGTVAESRAAKDQSKPSILEGWVLRDIYRGRALVENRYGLYEVVPGATLPGVGRVETITQQNGRWVVVTPKGLIVSMR